MTAGWLDAVTIDAYGTLMRLLDPVPTLVDVLARRGVQRSPEVVFAGFQAEAAFYIPRAAEGQDLAGLERLQQQCAGVFLEAVKADLDADEFAPAYVDAMCFEPIGGSVEALQRLRALGLELAVVANWDLSLPERLEEAGLAHFFSVVVHTARKPAPDGLLHALARLGISPQRALHIGDADSDEAAAHAAGMRFERAPLLDAVTRIR